ENRAAASRRDAVSAAARSVTSPARRWRSRSISSRASSDVSSSANRSRARSAQAMTPSTSSAYLRVSPRRAARRSYTAGNRAGSRVDPGDLVEAEPQQVGLLVPLAGVAPAVGEVVGDPPPLPVQLLEALQQLAVLLAGEPVERRALLGRAQQPQLVGLPVHR